MVKQKSKFKGLLKGVAVGFAFIMCSAFFPAKVIAQAFDSNLADKVGVLANGIKVNGQGADIVVKKGNTVNIPEAVYEYKTESGKGEHIIGKEDESRIKSSIEVFYKDTNDKVAISGNSFVADRVGRYTITYNVVDGENNYSYDMIVKCEVSEASFDFSANNKNIIPSVYDVSLTDKDIILPLPSVKDSNSEILISENDNEYFTNLDKNDFELPSNDSKGAFVTISLSQGSKIAIDSKEIDGKTAFYISNENLLKVKGQEIQVFYSYYQMSDNNQPVFVSSVSKTFTVKEEYYFKNSKEEEKGYDLETKWSSSTSDITAVVGIEKELPKITATTKSTNSPANEAVEVYYQIKVQKRGSNGSYSEDVTDKVITEDGKFKAHDEGSYMFTYEVVDFYGNKGDTNKTRFEITNVKDSRSASVFVYDGGNKNAYNEKENKYESALNKLKIQSGNRNVIMYAVGGTDNFVAKDKLTLRRTIIDNTSMTMFDISEKLYHEYNLIFAPARATGASESASVYQQIVADNYHIRAQMLLEGKKIDNDNEIKAFLKENKYLLVTTEFNKDFDGNDIVEGLSTSDEKATEKMMLLDSEGEVGYAYIECKNTSFKNKKLFSDGTYTFIYGAKDNINNETTTRNSVTISTDYNAEAVPTISFATALQDTYLPSDKIEFDVASATVSQDSRLDTVTAYRYLDASKNPVASDKTNKTLNYYIQRANSNLSSKWYAQTEKVIESEGWYFDNNKSSYKIDLKQERPQSAKYLEILSYAIDDYGNAGFFNKVITIADANDGAMPILFKIENLPSEEILTAPEEIELPTLFFTDDNVDYMNGEVKVYRLVKNSDGTIDKIVNQSLNMKTDFDSVRETFILKAGSFRASIGGDYQVAITVRDSGNHSYTTYFNYHLIDGIVNDKPEIENITSETIDLKAGQTHYLVPPTISVSTSDKFGYIGIDKEDDAKTATYYTTTIISATDSYSLDKYYFTGHKKGTFKLQYKAFLIRYSKDSSVFANSKDAANDGMIYLENDKLCYQYNDEQYYVYIEKTTDVEGVENYLLHANKSVLGIDKEEDLDEAGLKELAKIVKIDVCESKIQTINVGGVEINVTFDENVYPDAFEETDNTIEIKKPKNIEFNGDDYQTNLKDSTVTITRTSGNTTINLAEISFEEWANQEDLKNKENFTVNNGEISLKLVDNGRYTIKYSIQAMDKTGVNVDSPKTVEYTIKNGDVVGPKVKLENNFVKTTYKLGDTMKLNLAGLTVSDNVTEDVNYLKKNMVVRLSNPDSGSGNYITLENKSEVEGEYIYTHKLETAGTYTLTVIVKDKAGNETSSSVTFEVSTKESKDVDVKEVMGGVLIGLSVAVLAGVVIYFVVSKVKLDKKEKKYKNK